MTDVTFSAVEGLMNPVPIKNGCTIGPFESIALTIGTVTCTNQ